MGWSATRVDGRPVLTGQDAEASLYSLRDMPPMKSREYALNSAARKTKFLLVGGGSNPVTDPGRFWAIAGGTGDGLSEGPDSDEESECRCFAGGECACDPHEPEYRFTYAEYTIGPYSKANPYDIDTIRDCATRCRRWPDKFAMECLDWLTADYWDGDVRWSLRFAAGGDVFTLSRSDGQASSKFTVEMPTDGVPSRQEVAAVDGGTITFPGGWSLEVAGRTAVFQRWDWIKLDVPVPFALQMFHRLRARCAPPAAAAAP